MVEKVTQAQATKHVSSSPIDAVIRGLALHTRFHEDVVVCVCRLLQHAFCGRQQEGVPWRSILSSVPQRHWHPCANLAPSSVASAWMPRWKMGMFSSALRTASPSPTSTASQHQKNVRSVGRASPRKVPAHQKRHLTTCPILPAKRQTLLMTKALDEQSQNIFLVVLRICCLCNIRIGLLDRWLWCKVQSKFARHI